MKTKREKWVVTVIVVAILAIISFRFDQRPGRPFPRRPERGDTCGCFRRLA